jgi:hypothetical protein
MSPISASISLSDDRSGTAWHGALPNDEALAGAPTLTRAFEVVGTGVDPVTSRFSGARSTN